MKAKISIVSLSIKQLLLIEIKMEMLAPLFSGGPIFGPWA